MIRLLTLPLLLLGFAASAQTAPAAAGPRIGLSKPTTSPLYTEVLSMKPDPMYVVDGQVMESNSLSTIKPDQIESIRIIKPQAAAASLGPRVRNGVIVITTKPTVSSH